MDVWYVYVVQCADNSLYTGIAKDIEARLIQHNAGLGAKYTRARGPVTLVYQEIAENRGAALRKELEIKRLKASEKRALVNGGRL